MQPSSRRAWFCSVGGILLLFPALCLATDVRIVAVTPGKSADVVIDGGAPVTIEVGATIEKIKVLKADWNGAVVSVDGTTRTLPLTTDSSAGHIASSSTITLPADAHGQFLASGAVNGRPLEFLVDTGATLTTLSRGDATRIGLDYRGGRPTQANTVNGVVRAWQVSLASVRVGDVTVRDIAALVVDNDALPVGLLGMSFIDRFDMQRQGSTLILRRRR